MSMLYHIAIIFLAILLLPVMACIAFLVLITSGFPVLFVQRRCGKHGKPFSIYKFRTMQRDADRKKQLLMRRNEADGPVFKIHNDPRYTSIGKFLAHTGLDELPQIWNVLKGEMALIGPRPLPVEEAKKLTTRQQARHQILPGIISPWILEGYHKLRFADWMRSDIAYIGNKSVQYDVSLAGKTIMFLFSLLRQELKSVDK